MRSFMPALRRPLPRLALLALQAPLAAAQAPAAPSLEHCAAIGAATDRLACYDQLAGRAPAPTEPPAQQPINGAPPPTSRLQPKDAPPRDTGEASLLSKYWELEPQQQRGVFNLVAYQSNFIEPVHLTTHINRAPRSPTQQAVSLPAYRRQEAKFQLSLRSKLVQDIGLPGGDLWGAFTMQAMWQIYNGADSKPFRNTDYQPELIYVVPTPPGLRPLPFGWQWRYTQLGLAHQSNGQSDPLSRSWNRVYLGAGVERGDWSLSARLNQRLNERLASDNNPDLVDFQGRGELQITRASGLHTASLLYRNPLNRAGRGGLQFEWSYPVSSDQPNGLRWFFQVFNGYGETLTDYNFHQTSVGAGVSFLQF